ncbi:hypothetical protein [Nonomuraea basaltis]|uniref:hypothetical protein n=1 Tax=Nonomuraea basaltis TaxID=2495887 RepID=UPI00197E1303|nr:hypothetical protein [Nonomuraea basaltis]
MTIHEPRTRKTRMVGRFLRHCLEMVIAMSLGMLLLGLVWSAVLPEITRIDVSTLIMAADMSIGMAVWMRVRRHSWPSIAEMSLAMLVPFLILLVPYWFGALPGHLVMPIGHVLMFGFMIATMLRRRKEYAHQHRLGIRPKWVWVSSPSISTSTSAFAIAIGKVFRRIPARSRATGQRPELLDALTTTNPAELARSGS